MRGLPIASAHTALRVERDFRQSQELARVWFAVVAAALFVALGDCTPVNGPRQEPLDVRVEADAEVQAELDEVEVVVESRTPDANSWNLEASRRFNPNPEARSGWPLEFRVMALRRAAYQVTATARDQAGAITIQARTIQELDSDGERRLRVRLDRECLRRSAVCSRTQTCSFGDCLDAREALKERSELTRTTGSKTVTSQQVVGATAATACGPEGMRTCDLSDARQPLVCEQGTWRMLDKCADNDRCDLSDPMKLGSCQPLTPECATRKPGDLYCDADGGMHKCGENSIAVLKPCGENEHCVDVAHDVRCSCLPGFVPDLSGCMEASDCTDRGGCDPLTTCSIREDKRICSPCPAGFAGTGEEGCAPLLSGLEVSPGALDPAFAPDIKKYKLHVPLLTPQLELTAHSTTGAMLSINNAPASLDSTWSSRGAAPLQPKLPIELRAGSGVRTDYEINIERGNADQTYIKSSNCQRGGWFGEFFALHRDTIVVGAPLESVRADSGTQVRSAGAAYVFVRERGQWRQQAVLRASEPVTDASFGMGVDVWGDRIAVGASGGVQSILGTGGRNGVVYIYARSGDSWNLEQVIESGNSTQTGDAFGFRVTLRDSELLVGAPYDDEGASRSGAAYVYHSQGGTWTLQQRLKTTAPTTEGHYGVVTALDGDSLFVAATHESVESNSRAGAVYHYQRGDGGWSLVERIVAPVVRPFAQFGYSIAIAADTLVVSAPHNPAEVTSTRSGEVHVYKRDGGKFRHLAVLEHPSPSAGDYFGNSVSLTPSWLAVAAARDGTQGGPNGEPVAAGAVHLYARTDDAFVRSAVLRAETADEEDHFGDVLLGEDYVAVIAREEDGGSCGIEGDARDNSAPDSGALFVIQ